MSSTSIPTRKLGYLGMGRRNSSKPKDDSTRTDNDLNISDGRDILGGQPGYDLYAHMSKDNLNYIKGQIKEKQRKKAHQRAKSSVPEVQSPAYPTVQRNTHRDASCDREDRISEIEAYQEETERYQKREPFADEIQSGLSSKYFREDEDSAPVVRNSEMSEDQLPPEDDGEFISNLTGYIKSLERPSNRKVKSHSMHLKKTPVQSRREKENTIDLDLNRDKLSTLQRKYKKEKEDNAVLAKELQRYKRMDLENKQHIVRLQEKVNLLIRDIERLKHKHQLQIQKIEDIKHFVLNNCKNQTFEVFDMLSPKMRWKEKDRAYVLRRQQSLSLAKVQEEYRDLLLNLDSIKRTQGYFSKK